MNKLLTLHMQWQSEGRTWGNCLQGRPIFCTFWVIPNTCLQRWGGPWPCSCFGRLYYQAPLPSYWKHE